MSEEMELNINLLEKLWDEHYASLKHIFDTRDLTMILNYQKKISVSMVLRYKL